MVEGAMERIESVDSAERARGLTALRLLLPVHAPEEIVDRYEGCADAERR